MNLYLFFFQASWEESAKSQTHFSFKGTRNAFDKYKDFFEQPLNSQMPRPKRRAPSSANNIQDVEDMPRLPNKRLRSTARYVCKP